MQLSVWQALKSSAEGRKEKKKVKPTTDFHDPADQALYDTLREHRAYLAKKNSVPAYVIFGNRSLVDMVERKPQDVDEMAEVYGIGRAKMRTYGKEFLGVIVNFRYQAD